MSDLPDEGNELRVYTSGKSWVLMLQVTFSLATWKQLKLEIDDLQTSLHQRRAYNIRLIVGCNKQYLLLYFI